MEPLTVRSLFGGAIEMGIFDRFQDVTAIRQVPSNQMIFEDPKTEQTVAIEVVPKEDIALEDEGDAARFFYDRQVSSCGAISTQFTWLSQQGDGPHLK